MTETPRYTASDLVAFASGLLTQAGLPLERALNVAEILVEADLIGHTTHGYEAACTLFARTGRVR